MNHTQITPDYISQIDLLMRMIITALANHGYDIEDLRDKGLNPYYDRVTQGIVIRYIRNSSVSLCTVFGRIHICDFKKFKNFGDFDPTSSITGLKVFRINRIPEEPGVEYYAVTHIVQIEFPIPNFSATEQYNKGMETLANWEKLILPYLANRLNKSGAIGKIVTIKKLPKSTDIPRQFYGQEVEILDVYDNGYVNVNFRGISQDIPVTDLMLFDEGLI